MCNLIIITITIIIIIIIIYIYILIHHVIVIPVVPHKAVAEVSRI